MSLVRKLFFNLFYLRRPPWDTGISPPELMAFIETHSLGRALDLGCGTGTNVITLAQNGWQVTGVDFVGMAIRAAQRKAKAAGVQASFRVGDVTRLNGIAGPFDLILDIGCLHSLTDAGKEQYVRNLERLLAAEGTYLMYGFYKAPGTAGTGLTDDDLNLFEFSFKLDKRQDGFERGKLSSAWFTYTR